MTQSSDLKSGQNQRDRERLDHIVRVLESMPGSQDRPFETTILKNLLLQQLQDTQMLLDLIETIDRLAAFFQKDHQRLDELERRLTRIQRTLSHVEAQVVGIMPD